MLNADRRRQACLTNSPHDGSNAASARHQLVPHGWTPESHLDQVGEEVRVDDDELSGLHPSRVQIARVRLYALVEPAGPHARMNGGCSMVHATNESRQNGR